MRPGYHSALANRSIGGHFNRTRGLQLYGAASRRADRISIRSDEPSRRRYFQTSVARIQRSVWPIHCKEAFAGERQVQGVSGVAKRALRKVCPVTFDDRLLGGQTVGGLSHFGVQIKAVEFAIRLISAGRRIG